MQASVFWKYNNNSSEEKNAKKETTSARTIGIYELFKEKKKRKKGHTNYLWIRSKRQKKDFIGMLQTARIKYGFRVLHQKLVYKDLIFTVKKPN